METTIKTTKKIEAKARRIAKLISDLEADVLASEDIHISGTYRGYIAGIEGEAIDRYLNFANRLDYSISAH